MGRFDFFGAWGWYVAQPGWKPDEDVEIKWSGKYLGTVISTIGLLWFLDVSVG